MSIEGRAADAKAVGDALALKQPIGNYATQEYVNKTIKSKQDVITGTAGQFVVIGSDGKPTTRTIPRAEEEVF